MPLLTLLPALADPRLGAGFDLGRYLLVVGGFLVLLIGGAWAGRRWLTGSLRARAAKRSLSVVDVLPLGGRRQLAVVRCYDRTFVLGMGEKEVRLVAELEPEAAGVARPADAAAEVPATVDAETRRFERLVERARAQLDTRLRKRAAAEPAEEGELIA